MNTRMAPLYCGFLTKKATCLFTQGRNFRQLISQECWLVSFKTGFLWVGRRTGKTSFMSGDLWCPSGPGWFSSCDLFPVLLMTFQLTFQPLVGSRKLLRPLLLANWHLEAFLFFVVEGLSKWWWTLALGWVSSHLYRLLCLSRFSSSFPFLKCSFFSKTSFLSIESQPVIGGSW